MWWVSLGIHYNHLHEVIVMSMFLWRTVENYLLSSTTRLICFTADTPESKSTNMLLLFYLCSTASQYYFPHFEPSQPLVGAKTGDS